MTFTESFERTTTDLTRTIELVGQKFSCRLPATSTEAEPADEWDSRVLRGEIPIPLGERRRTIRIADLFCGAGGLSYGVKVALEQLHFEPRFELAADHDAEALEVFARNMQPKVTLGKNVGSLLDYHIEGKAVGARFSYEPEVIDFDLSRQYGRIDMLVAGPPCQGHSNLNNHTRRTDPKNSLYLTVPAFAVALNIPVVIIENIPEVENDHTGVLATALALLKSKDYKVEVRKLKGIDHGLAQTRTRLFVLASKVAPPMDGLVVPATKRPARPVSWAINDLIDANGPSLFDQPSVLDENNARRVAWLHENEKYDLPNEERPDCHKEGHTYKSVYGRMYWDQPAGTITSGFSVPGRGRFIHSLRHRTLTPHEAARIQGIPDSFQFQTRLGEVPLKAYLTKMIGNAVPPIFGQICTFCLANSLIRETTVDPVVATTDV